MDALEGRVGAMKIDVEGYEPQVSVKWVANKPQLS